MPYSDCIFGNTGKFSEIPIDDILREPILTKTIIWDLMTPSKDLAEKRQIKAFKRAFLRIGQVIPVKFHYVKDTSLAEIEITISNDDNYFKNRPNALAYAFVGTTSQDIDLVFNESYFWNLNREQGNNKYDLEVVAIHEILHILGLVHNTKINSVMFPNYSGLADMSNEDIANLQKIWGKRSGFSRRLLWLKGYFQRLL